MELNPFPMFRLVKRRLGWLSQRQEVISQNIANADTPKYASRDVKEFDFRDALKRTRKTPANEPVSLVTTDPRHIERQGSGESGAFKVSEDRRPYETAPDGNQVVLEEQMVKMNQTQATHGMMTQLYRKHMGFFKAVTRGGGGGG